MRFVLASASPRRAELLKAAGFTLETVAVDVDERPRPDEPPAAYVRRLAAEKSARALELLEAASGLSQADTGEPDRLRLDGGPSKHYPMAQGGRDARGDDVVVLGADTAVVVDGEILGKPRDDEDARTMLWRLSARHHEVVTGVSLRTVAGEVGRVETTTVWFAPLTPDAIAWYVSTGEGRDKAGAYAIQGFASRFIPRIEGSYSNVVGLPVATVADLLRQLSGKPPAGQA